MTTLEHSRSRRRWSLAVGLAILAVVGLVASVASRWTHDILFDTDRWIETVGPIGTSEPVTDALGERFSNALIEWIDAEERLVALLPPLLAPVAEPIADRVDQLIVDETTQFFESDFYEEAWLTVNRTAHSAAVAIVRDQIPFASTAGGVVTVDLIPLLTPITDRVFERLGEIVEVVPDVIRDQIDIDDTIEEVIGVYETEGLPDRLADVEVYSSERLAAIQQTTAVLDRLVWVLPVVTLLFAVAAVYMAPKRGRMVAGLLGGAALGWFLALLAVNSVVANVVSGIDSTSTAQVANEVFTGITSGLTHLLLTLGAVAALGAAAVVTWGWYRERTQDTPAG